MRSSGELITNSSRRNRFGARILPFIWPVIPTVCGGFPLTIVCQLCKYITFRRGHRRETGGMGRRCQTKCHAGPAPILDVDPSVDLSVQPTFDPLNSHILYASFRRRDEIHSWDLRGSTVTRLETVCYGNGSRLETNQRTRFDIDVGGKLMGVGDQVGVKQMSGRKSWLRSFPACLA